MCTNIERRVDQEISLKKNKKSSSLTPARTMKETPLPPALFFFSTCSILLILPLLSGGIARITGAVIAFAISSVLFCLLLRGGIAGITAVIAFAISTTRDVSTLSKRCRRMDLGVVRGRPGRRRCV